MTVTKPSADALRPSIIAVSGGYDNARAASIHRRQVFVDAVRGMTDDELADFLEHVEHVTVSGSPDIARSEMRRVLGAVYNRCGWQE